MTPATNLKEITKTLYGWSSFHAQWKIDFDSYALKTPDGIVFIDPMKPAPEVIEKLEALGEPLAVFLTNADHDRDADWFRRRYEIQVYAHEKAKACCDTKINVLVLDGEKLPGGVRVIPLPGTAAGSVAFYTRQSGGIVLIGDSLLNIPGKGLALLPAQYLEDKKQALQSLRQLLDLNFKVATFAHGDPLVKDAKKEITRFLKKATHYRIIKSTPSEA
jgi:glyoxylase-like metal-dependent hydrolase (beta-lactamase superfamily II)